MYRMVVWGRGIRCAAVVAGILMLCVALSAPESWAQSDLGKISGFVKDPSGPTVPNAKITVRSNNGGVERQATTNESGYYVITNVPPGLYTMTAEAQGFQKFESTNNKLDPSADLVIDASLVVGAATQTVEVTGSAVQLQTESASVQKLVTREQIDSLELNGRNPIWLAALVPGARGSTLASLNFGFTQGPSNFNGSRNPENLITFDGAPATRTRSNGTSLGAADVDSTQEVQILTTDYAPEYVRTSGARIRFTTKTGTQFVASSNPTDLNYSPACTNIAGCPNVIPANRLSPGGIAILNSWPVRNTLVGGGN